MRNHSRQSQWMFNLLVHGFDGAQPDTEPGQKVRTYRRDRLKDLVLCHLFEEYEEEAPKRSIKNTPSV